MMMLKSKPTLLFGLLATRVAQLPVTDADQGASWLDRSFSPVANPIFLEDSLARTEIEWTDAGFPDEKSLTSPKGLVDDPFTFDAIIHF